jgi:hypothetical protein
LHVLVGILPQPMVDVVGDHVASRGDGEKHQGERVGTARHRAGQRRWRVRETTTPQERLRCFERS